MLELFKSISKDKFRSYDLTEYIEDFKDYIKYSSNQYFYNLIWKTENRGICDTKYKNEKRKHKTKSELIVIKETNDRYIVLYSLERREKKKKFIYFTMLYF